MYLLAWNLDMFVAGCIQWFGRIIHNWCIIVTIHTHELSALGNLLQLQGLRMYCPYIQALMVHLGWGQGYGIEKKGWFEANCQWVLSELESWLLLWLSLWSLELILCISLGHFFGGIDCWGSYDMHKFDSVMYAYFVNQNSHSPYYWKTYLEPKLTRLPSFHFIFMLYGDRCHDNYLFWS